MVAGLPDRAVLYELPLSRHNDLNIGGAQMSTNYALTRILEKFRLSILLDSSMLLFPVIFIYCPNEGPVYAGQTNSLLGCAFHQ